jgi:hypothetical protein
MEETVTTFTHDSVTRTKPKRNPKMFKFVGEGTNFGNASFFECLVTSGFAD